MDFAIVFGFYALAKLFELADKSILRFGHFVSGHTLKHLVAAAVREETSIFFESPHRILKTLAVLADKLPDRLICVARELTKTYEEYRRGKPGDLLAHYTAHPAKGEIVLVMSGTGERQPRTAPQEE